MICVAFTVGRTSVYDRDLEENVNSTKVGAREDYLGGWVWKNDWEAKLFLDSGMISVVSDLKNPETFSVYELELITSWDEDVSLLPGVDGIHHLKHDAKIKRKVL